MPLAITFQLVNEKLKKLIVQTLKYFIMKNIKLLFQLILVLVILVGNFSRAQVSKTSQIPTLLKLAEKDSIQKIERLAALKFPQKSPL
jgi:hypothetical protein